MNNWIEIATGRLHDNFRAIRAAAGPEIEILAVVKANAYGHGAELCARTLVDAGARCLGVTSVAEAARVRNAVGPQPDILLMCGFLPEDVSAILSQRLTPVLWTVAQVASLHASLQPHPGLRVHVEIDTGMARQGVLPGEPLAELLHQLTRTGLILDGVFTHFASSEQAHSPLTQRQQRLFQAAVAQLQTAGARPRWLHAGNSSTVDNPLENLVEPANPLEPRPWLVQLASTVGARAMVRPGLALFGYCLPIEGRAQPALAPALQPVLLWKARVLAVRTLAPGETVGYNATFTAHSPMRIATLAVGYADGLRRELSSHGQQPRGWVIFAGRRAPILGRISMNLTVVDITGLPAVLPGTEAVILGEGITAHDHARLAGTIPYEILCGIHPCG